MATGVGPPNANRCRDERDEDPQQEQPPVLPPRVIRQPHRGGYDCEFLQRPPSGLVQADCPVCLLVLREPHQVTCCGYSYCQNCIERIQTTQKLCPTCSKEFDTFPDKRLKRSLYALKVYCSHREEGCDWVGELGELDRHLNLQPPPEKLLVGCQFSEVDCTYCVQPFQRRYIQAHQSDDCPKRPYACKHCNKHSATFKATYEEVTQNHWPVCPFFPLSCPNNCDLELILQRQEVEHHVSQDCPLTLVLCDFHVVGCQARLTRRDMPSHVSENLTGHMFLLQKHMMTHPGENMATYLWLMVGSIQKVVLDNANIRSELHEAQETLRDTRNELQESRDELQQSHDQQQETHYKLQGTRDELRGMNDKLQETNGKLQETREELRGTCETVAELEASGISQQEQNESLLQAIDVCQEENMTLQQQNDDLTERLRASEQKIQALDTQLAAINDEKKQLHHKLQETEITMAQLEKTVTSQDDRIAIQAKKVEECSTQVEQHQQNTTLVYEELQGKIQQSSTQLHATVTAHEKETTAALNQHKRESDEKLGAAQEEFSKNLIASKHQIQTALNTQMTQHKHELAEKLSVSEQNIQTHMGALTQQLQATVTAHKEETTAAQHILDQHKRENNEKLRTAKDELSKKLAASERTMQTALNAQQAALTQQKNELTEKLSASEQKLQTTLASQQTTITKCRDANRRLQQSLTEQERKQLESEAKLTIVKDDMTRKITASEQKIQTQEATLNQHQKTLEKVTYTGTLPFEFTMTEFKQHKRASDQWYSPPFYTHTHGYRMCITVDANGWGSGKGTHLTVYGYLMQGDFDNDLQWPFQGAITIQLLNQLEDSNHHTHTINFIETTDLNVISRVTSGERAGRGRGTGTFLSHTQLDLNTDKNCQFLKDNQLKFRVSKVTNLDPTAHIYRRCLTLKSFAGAIEPQVCVPPIEFTLSDFERQKKENDVWLSPAFYTHPQGYRMCLRVHPNGHHDGLGIHVSIYTCIMRGPFDGSLKWPFRGDVAIQIVNQAEEDNHQKRVIPYTDQTPDSSAGRVTDKERSDGRGFFRFLPHSSLGYNAARTTQYLRGDSLRIRISKVELKN